MRLLPVAFLLLLSLTLSAQGIDPRAAQAVEANHPVVASVRQLTIMTPSGSGYCSTFSINAEKGYWVTAAHCVKPRSVYYVEGEGHAWSVQASTMWDIAILRGPTGVPALTLAPEPEVGDLTLLVGHYYGRYLALGRVIRLEDDQYGRADWRANLIVVGQTYQGTSGGAITTLDGRLVSMIQGGSPGSWIAFTVGIPYPQLVEQIERYLPG